MAKNIFYLDGPYCVKEVFHLSITKPFSYETTVVFVAFLHNQVFFFIFIILTNEQKTKQETFVCLLQLLISFDYRCLSPKVRICICLILVKLLESNIKETTYSSSDLIPKAKSQSKVTLYDML